MFLSSVIEKDFASMRHMDQSARNHIARSGSVHLTSHRTLPNVRCPVDDNRNGAMQEDENGNEPKTPVENKYWGRQIDAVVSELSRLAIACDMDILDPNVSLKALRGD